MRNTISILLFLFISWNVSAQETITEGSAAMYLNKKSIAKHSILSLREGTLLVRLNTADKQLELLEKMKLIDKYEEVKEEQLQQNKSITSAFSLQMKFTEKVYYFYSDNTPQIINKEFTGVLMDKNLNSISIDSIDGYYLIADFNRTENLGIPALVIYDNNMKQMEAPFPYYTRTFESLPIFNRGHQRTVELFNDKLFFEYNQF